MFIIRSFSSQTFSSQTIHNVIIVLDKDLQIAIIIIYIFRYIITVVAQIPRHILAYHEPPYRLRLVGATTENQDFQVLLMTSICFEREVIVVIGQSTSALVVRKKRKRTRQRKRVQGKCYDSHAFAAPLLFQHAASSCALSHNMSPSIATSCLHTNCHPRSYLMHSTRRPLCYHMFFLGPPCVFLTVTSC